MPRLHFAHRLCFVAAWAALSAVAILGCSPAPTPEPTPTSFFTSEEEAFAAAEETYRAYADATNATDLTNPDTFEPVFDWLTGEAEASARENYSQFLANGITRTGTSTFDTFTPVSLKDPTVRVLLCLDVSSVALLDSDGNSVVPADRPERQPIEVRLDSARTSSGLIISSMTASEDVKC